MNKHVHCTQTELKTSERPEESRGREARCLKGPHLWVAASSAACQWLPPSFLGHLTSDTHGPGVQGTDEVRLLTLPSLKTQQRGRVPLDPLIYGRQNINAKLHSKHFMLAWLDIVFHCKKQVGWHQVDEKIHVPSSRQMPNPALLLWGSNSHAGGAPMPGCQLMESWPQSLTSLFGVDCILSFNVRKKMGI